jgi:two-component system response regulator RegA
MKDSILLVDDDTHLCQVMERALSRRGFCVTTTHCASSALAMAGPRFDYAIVDLALGKSSGLQLLPQLRASNPHMKIIIFTGYASIATTVEAIKAGADNYLAKPADADTLAGLLRGEPIDQDLPIESRPASLDRLEWEHIQRALLACRGNVSATARILNMHRSTLQRKLARLPLALSTQDRQH